MNTGPQRAKIKRVLKFDIYSHHAVVGRFISVWILEACLCKPWYFFHQLQMIMAYGQWNFVLF